MAVGWQDYLPEALALHRRSPVFLGYANYSSELFQRDGGRQSDLSKLAAAGVRACVISIGFGCYFQTAAAEYSLAGSNEWLLQKQMARIKELLEAIGNCSCMKLVRAPADLELLPETQIAAIVHLTGNNHTLSVETVDAFHQLGVRAWHPAMQYHNLWCQGQAGMAAPVLSDLGRKAVSRMGELGILVDTAHASDETARALIEASRLPVIDSHTTSRTRVPSCRGLSNDVLRLIARTGGVVGVHFADHMLTEEVWRRKWPERTSAGRGRKGFAPRLWRYNAHLLASVQDPEERLRLRRNRDAQEKFYNEHKLPPDPPASRERIARLQDLADMTEYLVKLVGDDHVGLGGDVNGIDDDQWPLEFDHVGQLPHLTAELLRRGFRETTLRKLLSDNWRRVYLTGLAVSDCARKDTHE